MHKMEATGWDRGLQTFRPEGVTLGKGLNVAGGTSKITSFILTKSLVQDYGNIINLF